MGAACNLKGRVVASAYVIRTETPGEFYLFLPTEILSILLNFWKLYLPLYRRCQQSVCAGDIVIVPQQTYTHTKKLPGGDLCRSFPFIEETNLVLIPADSKNSDRPTQQPQEASNISNTWNAFLMRQKTPFILAASSGKWTPQMLGYDRLGAVSYEKGCYLGQEVVARTHYLGKASRTCRLLEVTVPEPKPGMIFYNAKGDKSGEAVNVCPAGSDTDADATPNFWRCLAILNNNPVDLEQFWTDREQKVPLHLL